MHCWFLCVLRCLTSETQTSTFNNHIQRNDYLILPIIVVQTNDVVMWNTKLTNTDESRSQKSCIMVRWKPFAFSVEIVLIPETKLGGTTLSGTSGKLLHSCTVLAHITCTRMFVHIVRCCPVKFIEVFSNWCDPELAWHVQGKWQVLNPELANYHSHKAFSPLL